MVTQDSPIRLEQLPSLGRDRYRELFENGSDLQYTSDLEGRITAANRAAERLTGYSMSELLSMNVAALLALTADEMNVEGGNNGNPLVGTREIDIITKDGNRIPVEFNTRLIYDSGRPVGVHGVGREIGRRRQVEEQLLHLARHDPLTGLLNRRSFEEQLQVHLAHARRFHVPSALLFLDVDHFKDVNDSLGHRLGDEVLSEVALLLRMRLPGNAIHGRVGGDEFGVIVPHFSPDQVEPVARDLLLAMQKRAFAATGHGAKITASIGIAHIPSDGFVTAQELLSRADLAMYQAKEHGRNRAVVYSPSIDWHAQLEAALGWRKKVSEALEQDLFMLYAQPILDLADGGASSYELLLRLRDTKGRIVDAQQFIASAERFGLIRAIDHWVIERAVRLLAQHSRPTHQLRVALNISASSLTDRELLERLRSAFASTSAQPTNLTIEVTEHATMQSLPDAQRFVTEVKRIGCKVALDDFGVGSSSFAHLKLLDVDYLKIDGSFIRNLAKDETDRHLVRAIVSIARGLSKETVAEYVVDAETLALVRELGVDHAQGNHVGEPQDATLVLSGLHGAAERAA